MKNLIAEYSYGKYDDEFSQSEHFDDFVCDVQNMMKRMRIKNFFVYGLALTWRNIAGYTEFTTTDALTLINKITPNSDFSIRFEKTDNKGIVKVISYHHDKPMGEVMYLMSQSMEKKLGIKEENF